MKKSTQPLHDCVPIDDWAQAHMPDLVRDIKCHLEEYVESPQDVESLKRLFFVSLREWMDKFDNRETTVPNIGINDDIMCASRYRKISRQVCQMGGWANFEHYVNHSFVNEAHEFNKLAMFVQEIANAAPTSATMVRQRKKAQQLIEGLK